VTVAARRLDTPSSVNAAIKQIADVMRRLEKEQGDLHDDNAMARYLSTHPATAERIRRAEDAAR